jgi:hypothetical protein
MADPRDARDRREFLEQAAAETREPERAMRLRTDDSGTVGAGDTRSELNEAADRLDANRSRLRATGSALDERGDDLRRTRSMTDDVAARAESLRADTQRAADQVRATRVAPDFDAGATPTRDDDEIADGDNNPG